MILKMKIKCKKGRYLGRDPKDGEPGGRRMSFGSNIWTKTENQLFNQAWREAMEQELTGKELFNYLVNLIGGDPRFDRISEYAFDFAWIKRQIDRCEKNVFNRISRFENDCYLNRFNYFVTLTYDTDKMGDEETFRKKVRRALSNMATRFGWLLKGAFERGENNDRLHLHLLLRAEEGQMPGKLYTRSQYSTKRRRWEYVTSNSFFDKFGNNEFEAIDPDSSNYSRRIHYIAKYIAKSGERLFGSKHLVHEIVRDVDTVNDVQYVKWSFGKVYVLHRDLFWDEEKRRHSAADDEFTLSADIDNYADWWCVSAVEVRKFRELLDVVLQVNVPDWAKQQVV